jgi:hypothetical protein
MGGGVEYEGRVLSARDKYSLDIDLNVDIDRQRDSQEPKRNC